MVNLNAQRNLPPDSTPWGKAIERRLDALERAAALEDSRNRNNDRTLQSVVTNTFSRNVSEVLDQTLVTFTPSEVLDNEYKPLGLVLEGTSRTGSLLVMASIPLSVTSTTASDDSGDHGGTVTVGAHADNTGTPDIALDLASTTYFGIRVHKIGTQPLIYSGGAWNFPFVAHLKVRPGDFTVRFYMSIHLNRYADSPDWRSYSTKGVVLAL